MRGNLHAFFATLFLSTLISCAQSQGLVSDPSEMSEAEQENSAAALMAPMEGSGDAFTDMTLGMNDSMPAESEDSAFAPDSASTITQFSSAPVESLPVESVGTDSQGLPAASVAPAPAPVKARKAKRKPAPKKQPVETQAQQPTPAPEPEPAPQEELADTEPEAIVSPFQEDVLTLTEADIEKEEVRTQEASVGIGGFLARHGTMLLLILGVGTVAGLGYWLYQNRRLS